MQKILIIGIAGGTGSGKSTVTRFLKENFRENVSVLYHDDYYRRRDDLTYEERTEINYDEPAAYDTDLLAEHLMALRRGETVESPVYDYVDYNRSDKTRRIQPSPVIVVEGILILESKVLCDRLDLKIFVDTDADVRILRRIVRDVKERGRSLDSVISQYLTTVKPMHERYVEPSRRRADIIIPVGGKNAVALELLSKRIQAHIQEG